MKTILIILLLVMGMLFSARASTTSSNASIYTQGWNDLTQNKGTLEGDTNWIAVPFLSLNTKTHDVGWGAALLHYAAQNLWVGLRFQDNHGLETTAGVQAQLQVTKKIGWFTYTPFLETSVGIGSSSLYGSTGPGLVVNIHTWTWHWKDGQWFLGVMALADYEHFVIGTKNGNQVNAGPGINISFP